MIDKTNHRPLSLTERKNLLERALYVTPFHTLLEYEVLPSAIPINAGADFQFAARAQINKDFWLTNVRGNFAWAAINMGFQSEFNVSLYTNYNHKSVYGYGKSVTIPAGIVAQTTRYNEQTFNNLGILAWYDDTQTEMIPYFVPRGNYIISEIVNTGFKLVGEDLMIVLSGYQQHKYPYLDDLALDRINQSLEKPVNYQTFKVSVSPDQGQHIYAITNDIKPRLAIGFMVVPTNPAGAVYVNDSRIMIKDTTRELKLMNDEMPVTFIAPVSNCALDVSMYYLPVEYYMQPFCNLQIEINNRQSPVDLDTGYELILLTRTV